MKLRLALAFTLLSSCASKELVLKSQELKPLKSLEKVAPVTMVKGDLNILKFADNRQDKKTIGTAATGFFNVETPIYLDTPVEDFIKDRFSKQLAKRGVEVAGHSKYAFRGAVKRLWISETTNSWSPEHSLCQIELEFEIVTSKSKIPVYKGVISSSAAGTDFAFETTDSNGPLLESCANNLAEEFVKHDDLRKFLNIKKM